MAPFDLIGGRIYLGIEFVIERELNSHKSRQSPSYHLQITVVISDVAIKYN
jgi:hypothetical protein